MFARSWAIRCVTFAGFLLLLGSPAAFSQEISAKWSDVAPLISGQRVAIVLPNGVRIEGKAIAVHPDSLILISQRRPTLRLNRREKLRSREHRFL